jgi:hypothetical protein
MYHRISVDQLEFLVTIILGGDSLNEIFSLKEQDVRNLFFFHKSRLFFRAAAMSGATRLSDWKLEP